MALDNELSELYGGPLTDVSPSLYAQLEKGMKKYHPTGQAIIVMHQAPDYLSNLTDDTHSTGNRCLIWTYEQLHTAALRIVEGLIARGVQPGDTVMTFMPNGIEWPLIFWACQMLRLPLATLDPAALSAKRSDEMQNYMNMLKPRVVLVHHPDGIEHVEDAVRKTGIDKPRIGLCFDQPDGPSLPSKWCTISELATSSGQAQSNQNELLQAARQDDPDRVCLFLFTSGTSSGKPKCCPRHVKSMTSATDSNPFNIGEVRGRPVRYHLPTANFRVIAPTLSMATWAEGGTVIMSPPGPGGSYYAPGVLDAVEQHDVNILLLIPFMFHLLVSDPSFPSRKLNSLGEIWVGADIITRELFQKIQHAFPGAEKIVNGHGMTEAAAFLKWPFAETPIDKIPYFGNIAPIGAPSRGVRVIIRDLKTDKLTPKGEPGELCVSADSIIKHYLQNVNAYSFFSDETGRNWFRTGDFAMIDKDGIVFILGRIKDIIKRSGLSITAAALENCVSTFVGCTAAVVAKPHPTLGEEPYAIVKEWHGKTEAGIQANVLELFGKDYALAGATSLAELGMKDFPINGMGKMMKTELVEKVSAMPNHSN